MGLLSDSIVKAYFSEGRWEVGLRKQGQEVAAKGYARQAPAWSVDGSAGAAQVRFVFDGYAKFDEVVIFRDGLPVDRESFGGEVSLPPGAEWVHDLTVALSEV